MKRGNRLAWMMWERVQMCRHGEGMNLDFSVLFHLMELEGLAESTQIEIFGKATVLEASWQKRRQELERKAIEEVRAKHG